jgi:hypothetical protein
VSSLSSRISHAAFFVSAAMTSSSCFLFTGVTPCLDDAKACARGTVCDKDLGICTPPPPPPPERGTCGAPIPLELGVPAHGDTTGRVSALKPGGCQAGDAGELVYAFTPAHDGAALKIDLDPAANVDLEMYLDAPVCGDPFHEPLCVDTFGPSTREEMNVFNIVKGEPHFVVVDGSKVINEGPFTLTGVEIQKDATTCDPNDHGFICPLGTRCDASGTCKAIPGDNCNTAVRLNGTAGSEQEDTSTMKDDLDGGPYTVNDFTWTDVGPDMFYVVTLASHKTLEASLTSLFSIDQGIYLYPADTCPPATTSTLAFADEGGPGFKETLSFENTDATSRDVYVVVDSFATEQNGSFTLDWRIR